ncbi:hypothetical protein [Pyrococcus sp. ST04]|uniref:hypothetical protein n=1 Tax=Pyrococcus sp. ST04 TaxID=1183377 RepID=UPI00064F5DFD|nr:hypothetical protein [Pyrococcus sp. ST04]
MKLLYLLAVLPVFGSITTGILGSAAKTSGIQGSGVAALLALILIPSLVLYLPALIVKVGIIGISEEEKGYIAKSAVVWIVCLILGIFMMSFYTR